MIVTSSLAVEFAAQKIPILLAEWGKIRFLRRKNYFLVVETVENPLLPTLGRKSVFFSFLQLVSLKM